jgi:S-adenosylmethionine:tRNA ribosyltransferase-isomerase
MHEERYTIPDATAQAVVETHASHRRVWAVGTTTVRSLESAADDGGVVRAGDGTTRIFIRPPARLRVVDAIVTNFHLPRSTLIMLVAAVAGYELTMRAYHEAIAERYRFYSYGDAMAIV